MTQPSAKIIKDSISEMGHRLTTIEVVMHRFILAEFNTHRVFSRNSASSRAIPVHKIIDRVENDPAYPVTWLREQAGMQGGLPFNEDRIKHCRNRWDQARESALRTAKDLASSKLHKSLVNRLLEPFMWHTAIVSATEWANFFHQRCDKAAQPEMKALADAMQLAYYQSTPEDLDEGDWHLPYINPDDWAESLEIYPVRASQIDALKKVSTARCARVSYLTHDGQRSLGADLDLYNKLLGGGHWSPFEHVATPMHNDHVLGSNRWSGNFRGWMQFRKQFPNENRVSFTPNLPELEEGQ